MHLSRFITLVALLVVGCSQSFVGRTDRHDGWEGRDIAELVEVLGPFETTLIQRGVKTYNWFRFGNCRLTARVSADDKIVAIETAGTAEGCHVYTDRLRRG